MTTVGSRDDAGTLLLGHDDLSGDGEDRRCAVAEAAFARFPRLMTIASIARHVAHVDLHRRSARVETRKSIAQTEEVKLAGIVDRIGGGDAFAAGVLHALRSGDDVQAAPRTGLGLAARKRSLPGDAALFHQADIDGWLSSRLDVRR